MYANIVNPDNGNLEKTNSVPGKSILRKYMNLLNKLSKGQTGGSRAGDLWESTAARKTRDELAVADDFTTWLQDELRTAHRYGADLLEKVADLEEKLRRGDSGSAHIKTLNQITIPPGVEEGDKFEVVFPPMRQIRTCPADKKGGDIIQVSPCFLPNYILSDMEDPISLVIMKDPVITSDGVTYERKSIEDWVEREGTHPVTGAKISLDDLIPNLLAKKLISGLCKFSNSHQPVVGGECSSYETDGAAPPTATAEAGKVETDSVDIIPGQTGVPEAPTFGDAVLQRVGGPPIELGGGTGADVLPVVPNSPPPNPVAELIKTLEAAAKLKKASSNTIYKQTPKSQYIGNTLSPIIQKY